MGLRSVEGGICSIAALNLLRLTYSYLLNSNSNISLKLLDMNVWFPIIVSL